MPDLMPTAKVSDLIYDVGLHHGQDTDFYLKKGFRVVAFEADPPAMPSSAGNASPRPFPADASVGVSVPDEAKQLVSSLVRLKPNEYVRSWTQYKNGRGMNRWHDIIDWVGGYPYEVASVDQIFEFYKKRGFLLTQLRSGGVGLGCNEFVFKRSSSES